MVKRIMGRPRQEECSPQDNALGLMHLRRLFTELCHPPRHMTQKEQEEKLYMMLPVFNRVSQRICKRAFLYLNWMLLFCIPKTFGSSTTEDFLPLASFQFSPAVGDFLLLLLFLKYNPQLHVDCHRAFLQSLLLLESSDFQPKLTCSKFIPTCLCDSTVLESNSSPIFAFIVLMRI